MVWGLGIFGDKEVNQAIDSIEKESNLKNKSYQTMADKRMDSFFKKVAGEKADGIIQTRKLGVVGNVVKRYTNEKEKISDKLQERLFALRENYAFGKTIDSRYTQLMEESETVLADILGTGPSPSSSSISGIKASDKTFRQAFKKNKANENLKATFDILTEEDLRTNENYAVEMQKAVHYLEELPGINEKTKMEDKLRAWITHLVEDIHEKTKPEDKEKIKLMAQLFRNYVDVQESIDITA